MFDFTPRALLTVLRSHARLLAFVVSAGPLAAQSGTASGYATLRGYVADSVHGGALAGATVDLLPNGRTAMTNDRGEFRFDSIAPGTGYAIRVAHPMLDTIGIALTTPPFALAAGEAKDLTFAVPSGSRLVEMFCPPGMLARGPSALIGFVRDPDTGSAIDSATVSLVYDDNLGGLAKRPVNRVAQLDQNGRYKICGLPAQMNGRVQMIRNGTQSADIPVSTEPAFPLALRSLGMSLSTQHVATGKDSAGKAIRVLRGLARITGHVMSKAGTPIAGARVQMDETTAAAVTGADGRFTLDSVPTGTQTLSVRKLGYNVADKAVEVSVANQAPVTVTMENYIPTLATVYTVAQRDQDLEKVGFTRRRRMGIGTYRDGEEIPRGTSSLATALSGLPGIHSVRDDRAGSSGLRITGTQPGSCVSFVVDGMPWVEDQSMTISDYVSADEIQAVELYTASTAPPQFAPPNSNCSVLMIWTTRRIRGNTTKTKKPPV